MKTLRAIVLGIGVVAFSAGGLAACGSKDKKDDTTPKANPCNPCAKDTKANPCNPCGGEDKKANPCADGDEKKANPCNPCGGATKNPCNPCGK